MRRHHLTTIFFILIWGCSCSIDNIPPKNEKAKVYYNNLFVQTSRITAAATSAATGFPNFSWSSTGKKHVVCAIFSENIQTKNNRITNSDKIVWLWHSGLGKGREGSLLYENGIKGEKNINTPNKIPKGTYYWGVWVLDIAGKPIPSTLEYTFVVTQ